MLVLQCESLYWHFIQKRCCTSSTAILLNVWITLTIWLVLYCTSISRKNRFKGIVKPDCVLRKRAHVNEQRARSCFMHLWRDPDPHANEPVTLDVKCRVCAAVRKDDVPIFLNALRTVYLRRRLVCRRCPQVLNRFRNRYQSKILEHYSVDTTLDSVSLETVRLREKKAPAHGRRDERRGG